METTPYNSLCPSSALAYDINGFPVSINVCNINLGSAKGGLK